MLMLICSAQDAVCFSVHAILRVFVIVWQRDGGQRSLPATSHWCLAGSAVAGLDPRPRPSLLSIDLDVEPDYCYSLSCLPSIAPAGF